MFDQNKLIDYLKNVKKATFLQLVRTLNINQKLNKNFSKYLNELKSNGLIGYNKKEDSYYIPTFISNEDVSYKINIRNAGLAFVKINNRDTKITIFNNSLNALKDDIVNINIYKGDDDFYFGIMNSIVKRKNEFIYFEVDQNLNTKVLFFNQDINFEFDKSDLKPNTYAKFKIESILNNKIILKYDSTLFDINQPYSDINLIVDFSNVHKSFNNNVINESNLIPDEVKNEKEFNRENLTNKLIVTIDGEKTKDFDDAISVEKTNDGNYLLGVHIADVAYYVKENTSLDLEARERGTSIYLIDKVIPMLPEKLSNGICSLNPNVKRFTLSLEATIDKNGNVLNHRIFPSMIESKFRLTYNQVANLENDEIIKNNGNLYNMLKNAYELSNILSNNKINDGYIDFEIEEPIIELDQITGKTIDIKNRIRKSSEIMIENFMVFANEKVSETLANMKIPSIYRIHAAPSEEQIESLKLFIKALGINGIKVKQSQEPKDFQQMVNELKEIRFDNLIKMSLLRTMQKAKYSTNNIGHFGLASKFYSHFTSPIRRYPDLLLHRIIWEVIIKKNVNYSINNESLIEAIAKNSTECEIKATELERKVNDVKKADFYENKINSVLEATIVSIQRFGMFVEFNDLTNSLIHISRLCENNEFEISNDMTKLILKNKTYQIGQKIKVRIISINKLEGKIDSEIID